MDTTTSIPSPTPAQVPSIAARAEDLVKIYGAGDAEVRALDGISIGFPTGGFSAVMGPCAGGAV